MDQNPAEIVEKPPLPLYPPPDFSVPPPAIKESTKLSTATTTKVEKSMESRKETSRHRRSSSRDRDRSRFSPKASSSRDYRSQSRYSSSSRFSSQRDLGRDSYKRKRSRSRTRSPYRMSSRRSSTRRSPHRDKSSRRSLAPRDRDNRDSRSTRESAKPSKPTTERERLLKKWRNNYCETSEQISKKLLEMSKDEEQASWIRASPADIHYRRTKDNVVESTPRLDALCTLFDDELLKRAAKTRANQVPYTAPNRRQKIRVCRHKCEF